MSESGSAIDSTHDAARPCWVPGADGHPDFPIQNLPLGVFSPPGEAPRGGVAIGDFIIDLAALAASGALGGAAAQAAAAGSGGTLNPLLALGAAPRRALRAGLSALLSDPTAATSLRPLLHAAAACRLHLPTAIGDYTDFYAGIHHATNVGRLFRPDNPLVANYKHIPIAYHGRASSVRPSGIAVRRPNGQTKPAGSNAPLFGASQRLDYELELGVWLGPGNAPGASIPVAEAGQHIAGYCLLNDWSARDFQTWETQPLGPFTAKNFATTISGWMITPEALAPFRTAQQPRPAGDPAPLPYLLDSADQAHGALALALEVSLLTPAMRAGNRPPHPLGRSDARHLYWTPAQMVAHHSAGGCHLRPGDLFGTGTISGPDAASCGSLLEASQGGTQPVILPGGETRCFLEDGDEVFLTARASREGFAPIGFGECRAVIASALAVA
jgi:fumarylacetoacetase